jgi:hypothetical protein
VVTHVGGVVQRVCGFWLWWARRGALRRWEMPLTRSIGVGGGWGGGGGARCGCRGARSVQIVLASLVRMW